MSLLKELNLQKEKYKITAMIGNLDINEHFIDGVVTGFEESKKVIKKHSDWIPISEKLPNLNDDGYSDEILISDKWDEVTEGYLEKSIFLKSEGKLVWESKNGITYNFDEITAWMPKPKPYKK